MLIVPSWDPSSSSSSACPWPLSSWRPPPRRSTQVWREGRPPSCRTASARKFGLALTHESHSKQCCYSRMTCTRVESPSPARTSPQSRSGCRCSCTSPPEDSSSRREKERLRIRSVHNIGDSVHMTVQPSRENDCFLYLLLVYREQRNYNSITSCCFLIVFSSFLLRLTGGLWLPVITPQESSFEHKHTFVRTPLAAHSILVLHNNRLEFVSPVSLMVVSDSPTLLTAKQV